MPIENFLFSMRQVKNKIHGRTYGALVLQAHTGEINVRMNIDLIDTDLRRG